MNAAPAELHRFSRAVDSGTDGGMYEAHDGEWVEYDEASATIAALQAQIAELEARQVQDQAVDVAQALEQQRALHIVTQVATLPISGHDNQTPTSFQAGYMLACEEIECRLRTQQWSLGDAPSPLPAAPSNPTTQPPEGR